MDSRVWAKRLEEGTYAMPFFRVFRSTSRDHGCGVGSVVERHQSESSQTAQAVSAQSLRRPINIGNIASFAWRERRFWLAAGRCGNIEEDVGRTAQLDRTERLLRQLL